MRAMLVFYLGYYVNISPALGNIQICVKSYFEFIY